MHDRSIRVLLIEDNPGDARLIQEALAEVRGAQFHLECADHLLTGLERLSEGGIGVILLDLSLPDSHGLNTFVRAHNRAPEVPIVVLTGIDDESLAMQAVHEGAQDYLVKGQVHSNLLARSLRYAIERQRIMAELRNSLLIDDLTGLYNRRAFLNLAEEQLKIADRTKRRMFFVFADLDNMKWINDVLSHRQGDLALIDIANILKETFRRADIIGRIGGDEFAVIAVEAREDLAEVVAGRLQKNLDIYNAKENHRYRLSISIGIARYDPEQPCSLDELLSRADRLMYEHKRAKQKSA